MEKSFNGALEGIPIGILKITRNAQVIFNNTEALNILKIQSQKLILESLKNFKIVTLSEEST